MARSYSQDLRNRVIAAVLKDGLSRREAGRRFGICYSTAIRWLDEAVRHNRFEPKGTGGHRPLKLASEQAWLLEQIEKTPDITLAALAKELLVQRQIKASPSMLSRFFKREGISFKKNAIRRRTRQA